MNNLVRYNSSSDANLSHPQIICFAAEWNSGGATVIASTAVILNDLKCRLENTSFDYLKHSEFTKRGPKRCYKFAEIKFTQFKRWLSA